MNKYGLEVKKGNNKKKKTIFSFSFEHINEHINLGIIRINNIRKKKFILIRRKTRWKMRIQKG